MGMYDTINGEQVKCFPWVSLYNNVISYHGGDLNGYGIGDEVPYKKPHYNYGKNFVVLDLNRCPGSYFCDYDYILHVIVDGKVQETFEDKIGEIDWATNESVVGYSGELLNINNSEDLLNFIKAQREFNKKYDEISKHKDELFRESMQYLHGIARLEKDSEERKFRQEKLEGLRKLMDEERARIKPQLDNLTKEHSKWFIHDYDDLIQLGDYLSAYYTELMTGRSDNVKVCNEMISKLLDSDATLYDRYVAWQDCDEYLKEFV